MAIRVETLTLYDGYAWRGCRESTGVRKRRGGEPSEHSAFLSLFPLFCAGIFALRVQSIVSKIDGQRLYAFVRSVAYSVSRTMGCDRKQGPWEEWGWHYMG